VDKKECDAYIILLDACRVGDLKSIQDTLSASPGFDIHQGQERCLCAAARKGHLDIVKYLVEEHDVNIHADDSKALLWAADEMHHDVVEYLIKCGADYHDFEQGVFKQLLDWTDLDWARVGNYCADISQKIKVEKQVENRKFKNEKFQKNVDMLKAIKPKLSVRRRPKTIKGAGL